MHPGWHGAGLGSTLSLTTLVVLLDTNFLGDMMLKLSQLATAVGLVVAGCAVHGW